DFHVTGVQTCALPIWLGVRADMTPQVARIDAHLLGRKGPSRLCYAGPVLHARPADLFASRVPYQVGAELYGHAGQEAELEILDRSEERRVGTECRLRT